MPEVDEECGKQQRARIASSSGFRILWKSLRRSTKVASYHCHLRKAPTRPAGSLIIEGDDDKLVTTTNIISPDFRIQSYYVPNATTGRSEKSWSSEEVMVERASMAVFKKDKEQLTNLFSFHGHCQPRIPKILQPVRHNRCLRRPCNLAKKEKLGREKRTEFPLSTEKRAERKEKARTR